MNDLHNKHGPESGFGKSFSMRSRDGTGGMPRDGTTLNFRGGVYCFSLLEEAAMPCKRLISLPRDKIARKTYSYAEKMPRDAIQRMPRDAVTAVAAGFTTGNAEPVFLPARQAQIRGKTRFRWRTTIGVYRPFGAVMGEVCPVW